MGILWAGAVMVIATFKLTISPWQSGVRAKTPIKQTCGNSKNKYLHGIESALSRHHHSILLLPQKHTKNCP